MKSLTLSTVPKKNEIQRMNFAAGQAGPAFNVSASISQNQEFRAPCLATSVMESQLFIWRKIKFEFFSYLKSKRPRASH
jgi:hypothetical protein